ncbi:MAG TPA: ABC transporter permease subunit [Gemmataceae bacterium]|nr:ABC transporter permease subunit [Gemmataceae bacterium]
MLGPIFNREWLTVPRRPRHYVNRAAYLGLLWVLGLTAWQMTVGWTHTATLGDAARFGLLLFQIVAFVELTLLVFFAALAAVSTITLEKDRRTFLLLLLTDLRDHEIVLGKLFGSLLQIGTLVAGTIPVLALLLLLGGIAPSQLLQAVLVIAAAVLAAGSLGGLVALWRDRTFPALALTVLFLVLYLSLTLNLPAFLALLGPAVVALLAWGFLSRRERYRSRLLTGALVALVPVAAVGLWWFLSRSEDLLRVEPVVRSWLHPFVALASVVNPPADADASAIPAAYGCAAVMLLLSAILNGWGILWLRVWNPSGEPIMQRESPEDANAEEKDRLKAHASPGKVRQVWANPILWREIATRAYGRRPFLVKVAYFIVLGLVCYYALAPVWAGEPGTFATILGLVLTGVLSLLLVSAQAVTAITSERDTGALDLLLVTDLTPKEFIFGKVLGICWNTKEYLLPPLILAVVYGCLSLLATPPRAHPELAASRNAEALACVVGAAVVLLAFALMLGMHVALRTQNSRLAIVNTLGTVFFLSVGTGVCIALIRINRQFEYQWASFVLFILAGIGGLWWVLSGERPSAALTLASWLCPLAVFYSVTNILVARPGSDETGDPLVPFLVMGGAFGFTVAAMLVPLISEFDVALGRTSGGAD